MKLILNYVSIFVVAFLFAGCGDNITGLQEVSLNQEFELSVKQTAHVEDADLLITFVKVLEDSRCPEGAICVWQGNGKVELIISAHNQEKIDSLNTFLEPKELHIDEYRIELIELIPYPVSGEVIDSEDYVMKLKVNLLDTFAKSDIGFNQIY